ncbi:hypothetical protein [Planctomycetes bacterium TBK1r]|uniref:Uncharacterized protein n=1 Tax=Stieleria magnilauensis TaxID=2527963 RepID=A0ABX5XIM9_9BACT|nr:hypothetical protein TBK1r_01450 [Planctomycetes bacterium TBK1r]
MDIISSDQRAHYRANNTRTVTLPDGRCERVYMPPSLWIQYEALQGLEGLSESDVVDLALQEMSVQPQASFSECFRCVVTDRVLAWFDAAEQAGLTADSL